MTNKHLLPILTELGLASNEAAVYLASLSLGPTTIQKISTTAEIKRTTTYHIISALQAQGLMRVEVNGFKKLFAAEDPQHLEHILDNRKNVLAQSLPELAALYNFKGGDSSIKFYEGLTGIKSVYESLIKDVRPKEDYIIVSNIEKWLYLDKEFFTDFTYRRAKLPIKIRLLLQDTPLAHEHKKIEKNLNEKIKILPKSTTLNTNLVVIPKRVVIHQLTPPVMAIVIENPSVVKMHQELFEIIWQSLPE